MVLPTFSVFTDDIPEHPFIPDSLHVNPDHDLIYDIIRQLCEAIQYRVVDENNLFCGYIADDLFYPCDPPADSFYDTHPLIRSLPTFNVKINPLKLNKQIFEY
jgi:hypothetical protein